MATSGRAIADPPDTDAIVPVAGSSWVHCGSGSPGDYNSGFCRTDNATVSHFIDTDGDYALESADINAVSIAMADEYNPTNLDVWYDSTPVFSGPGETDVVYQEGSYDFDDNTVGVTWCDDPTNGEDYLCDQAYIMIRAFGNYSETTAAHETGHAVGLVHPSYASPVGTPCQLKFHVMRENLDCIDGPELGSMLTHNIAWMWP
jgi:hypothetical protein